MFRKNKPNFSWFKLGSCVGLFILCVPLLAACSNVATSTPASVTTSNSSVTAAAGTTAASTTSGSTATTVAAASNGSTSPATVGSNGLVAGAANPPTAVSGTVAANTGTTNGSTQAVPVNSQVGTGATTTILNPGVVSWAHIGDLHITTADQQNYTDFKTIISNINQYLKNGINFTVLPGDNANDDAESEYQLIKQATDQLQVPLYAVPGDHDHKSGLTSYNKYMEPSDYYSFSSAGYHFAFLDVMSGVSADEKGWLITDLDNAAKAGLKSVLFMHSYTIASTFQDVIQRDNVLMLDAGHTHYNAVANDGHTIYAATRSTGQVTEGPVGFSIVNLDNGVVSWKFKPLGSWPFVMITSPSDKQLMVDGSQVVSGTTAIRAKIWDDKGVASASAQVDGGTPIAMQRIGDTQMWTVSFDSTKVSNGDHKIKVNVTGAGGNTSEDQITVTVNQAGSVQLAQRSFGASGNDIGAYAEKGLLGSHTSSGSSKGAPCTTTGTPTTTSGATNSATPSITNTTTTSNAAKPGCGPGGGKGGAGRGKGGPNVTATVVSINGDQLILKLQNGMQQTVFVNNSTQITQQDTGAVGSLQAGETVIVHTQNNGSSSNGSATPGASNPSVATSIQILPTQTQSTQSLPTTTPNTQ